jgi:hypothetical protein
MIRYHREPHVYKMSVEAAMHLFTLTKSFPKEETETFLLENKLRSHCLTPSPPQLP